MSKTNDLTQSILRILNASGEYKAWRNNNGALYDVKRATYRKNPTHLKGVFDIVGFSTNKSKTPGRHLEIEIKTGKDKMSAYQDEHKTDLLNAVCIAFIVGSLEDFKTKAIELGIFNNNKILNGI